MVGMLLKKAEAARILGVSAGTFAKWRQNGIVKTYKVKGVKQSKWYLREQIETLIITKGK